MIKIRFESDQNVRPLLRTTIAFGGLCGNKRLIRIFCKGGCVYSEGRACHDELGEGLFCVVEVRGRLSVFFL